MIYLGPIQNYAPKKAKYISYLSRKMVDSYAQLKYEVYQNKNNTQIKEFVIIWFWVDDGVYYSHVIQWNEKHNHCIKHKVHEIITGTNDNDEKIYAFVKRNWKKIW